MKRIYLILTGLILSFASFAIGPITGAAGLCVSGSATLSDSSPGGVWSSSNATVATIGTAGVVGGVAAGTANITYSIGASYATTVITVNADPAPISGAGGICNSATVTLTDATSGGNWYSSAPGIAGIGSASGTVTGVSAGTAMITYILPTGCKVISTVPVNPTPTGIGGSANLCGGSSVLLTDGISGGIWSSSNVAVATIGASSGILSGISAGTLVITYTTSCGIVTEDIAVNPIPVAIVGGANVCIGAALDLSDATAGGTWVSSAGAIAAVGSASGIVGGVSGGVVTITYLMSTGCMATKAVTVIPNPNPISGSSIACLGATTILFDALSGGTWASSNTSVATIGISSGLASGVSTGTTIITYTVSGYCSTFLSLAVHSDPPAITGPASVCSGASITLADPAGGGTWGSSAAGIASVGSISGSVAGVSAGTVSITYVLAGCQSQINVVVQPSPAAITGLWSICTGTSDTLSDATLGGVWSSSGAGAPINTSGVVAGITAGVSSVSYTIPATGCLSSRVETIVTAPAAITGPSNICGGAYTTWNDVVPGGNWSSSAGTIAVGSGTGVISGLAAGTAVVSYTTGGTCVVTAPITVDSVAVISGPAFVCTGTINIYNSSIAGGAWSSAATDVSIGSGTGAVTGISPGSAILTYALPAGCVSTRPVTVYPSPGAISGIFNICTGATSLLSDATGGGAWTSSNIAVATATPATGMITGVSAGTAIISYLVSSGCMVSALVNVHPSPAPISGTANGCVGTTLTLGDTTAGGSWSSGAFAGIAAIGSASGMVTAVAPGTAVITYTLPATGCAGYKTIMINVPPPAISGSSPVCAGGGSITLSDMVAGGTWISGNTTVATIGSGAGIVTGVSAGTVSITYRATTGCGVTKILTVNPLPAAITGSSGTCLFTNDTLADATMGGTWSSSSFGAQIGSVSGIISGIGAGPATISYTLATGCAAVFPFIVNTVPARYTIIGGGGYCAGSGGAAIRLSASDTGIEYLLYSSGTGIGSFPGTGSSIDFGLFTVPAIYTAIAVNPLTGCSGNMLLSATVMVNPLPSIDTVTGGGSYCAGGAGVAVGLSQSGAGVDYRLFRGGVATGGVIAGTGSALSFGMEDTSGLYTITAAYISTGCVSNMYGNATIIRVPGVTPSVSITMSPGDTVCAGTPVTFTAVADSGGAFPNFQWTVNGVHAGADSTGFNYIPSDMDVVSVRLASSAACATPADTMSTVAVTVNPYPVAIAGETNICQGATTSLTDSTPGGTWVSSATSVASIATFGISTGGIIGLSAGTSVITYIPADGCIITTMVTVNPLPVITASAASAGCGGKYIFTAAGGVSYFWTPSSGLSCDSCAITDAAPGTDSSFAVTGTDALGCSATSPVSINGNRISGHVTFGGAVPDSLAAMVWLIQFNPADSFVISTDSMLTCTDGGLPYYEFDGKPNGYYRVKVELLSGNNPGGKGYIPTYGYATPYWDSSASILHSGAADTLHIGMVYGNVSAGVGSISGTIYSDTGVAPGMPVFLTDGSGNVLTYTYTGPGGDYSFTGLAYANYTVYPEDYIYYTTPVTDLALSSAAGNVGHVDFRQYSASRTIVPLLSSGIKSIASSAEITLYPNPTTGNLDIKWSGLTAGSAEMVITDVMGREAYRTEISFTTVSGHTRVDLSSLKDGVYFVSMVSGSIHYTGKLQVLR